MAVAKNRSLLVGAVSGILGAAMGAGAVLLVDPARLEADRVGEDADLREAGKAVAEARAERDRALATAEALRRENSTLRERKDRPRTGGAAGGAAPPAPAGAPAPGSSPASGSGPPPVDPGLDLQRSAGVLSRKWVADAVQIRDEAKRSEAIAAVRTALSSGDPLQVLAGLFAVSSMGQVPYDKASMRPLVLAQFEAADPLLRKAAVNGILATSQGPDPANLDLLLRLKDDPSPLVRKELAPAVSWAARGDLTGEAGAVVLRAIQDIEAEAGGAPRKGRGAEFIQQLGGRTYFRRMSPEIEEKVLALARDPETQQSALHFFFQNMEKTPKVVDLLLEIADAGGGNSTSAIRALTYEVPADQAPRVAAFLVKVLESGPSHEIKQVLYGLRNFGTEAELPAMERLAANELLDAGSRRMITDAVESIRRRPAQPRR